jgi:hypothetical protein
MRILFISFLALFLFTSCEKQEEVIENNQEGIVKFSGDFVSDVHTTSGKVSVKDVNGAIKVAVEGLKGDSGPDLRLYLAEDKNAKNSIEIKLGVPNGTYTVDVNKDIDFTKHKYVLIWCKSFSVLFGSALLK